MGKIHVSLGNSKVGEIPSFSLLGGGDSHIYDGTIPNKVLENGGVSVCGSCPVDCPGCYTKKMTRYENVLNAYAENTFMAYAELSEMERQLSEYFGTFTGRFFRLHVSGDFASENYFMMWIRIAKEFSDIRFYTYTKRISWLMKHKTEIPENLVISVSPWEGVCDIPENCDNAQFIYDDGSNPELSKLPHCPAVDKNGKKTGITCSKCKHCILAKPGDKWAVYAH